MRVPVPVKERSHEIFGDEKTLERVLESKLSAKGGLTLEILRCYRVPIVPVHRVFAGGIDTMIVENEATFDSVCRWNHEHRMFRMVVYGRGREAEKIAQFLLGDEDAKSGAIYYFGDLDRLGISIPYRLSRTLERRGSQAIRPADACYRLLLQQLPTAVKTVYTEDESEELPDSEWLTALNWVPPHLRNQIEALLSADQRIAQEATGWDLLRKEKSLI